MLLNPGGPNAGFFASIISALTQLQQPKQPGKIFSCATADMPPAAKWPDGMLRNTTLNILAVSDGVNWIRQDTGAAI